MRFNLFFLAIALSSVLSPAAICAAPEAPFKVGIIAPLSGAVAPMGEAFRRGINNTIGICFSVLLVGVVRELLAEGTVFGNVVFPVAPLPLADQPGTGFIIIGLIAAVWTAIGGAYVHYKIEEVRHLYGNKRKR